MGAQDDLAFAQDFLTQTGVETPLMIWDQNFESWIYYGVNGQPTAILVDAAGNPVQGWRGAIDEEAILAMLDEA